MSMLQHISDLAEQCRRLVDAVSDPYHPERHYMRGPGPKWRARYGLKG